MVNNLEYKCRNKLYTENQYYASLSLEGIINFSDVNLSLAGGLNSEHC